jgi:tetratricopeptide (TPR) repeat protein
MGLDEHARAGIAAINDQRFDDAISEFTAALAIDAERPDLNNALGMAYMHRGDVGNAVGYLERAVTLAEPFDKPEHQDMKRHFYSGLGSAYQLLDRVSDARRLLEETIRRWPADVTPRLQLGQLLLGSCQLTDGVSVYKDALSLLDGDQRAASEALIGSIELLLDHEDEDGQIFLRAHQAEYVRYFDDVTSGQEAEGWYTEAARMGRGADGEPVPIVADGARKYALTRVDLVNPADGTVAGVYSEKEPMVVSVEGLEPLAQVPILVPWAGWAFDVWVCSQAPWHWLPITIQFEASGDPDAVIGWVDDTLGSWYLDGWNGEFGTKDKGRFHYVTDPELVGDRGVSYILDLGRASYDAVGALMRRLVVLHDSHPIRRVLFGQGRLPDHHGAGVESAAEASVSPAGNR